MNFKAILVYDPDLSLGVSTGKQGIIGVKELIIVVVFDRADRHSQVLFLQFL